MKDLFMARSKLTDKEWVDLIREFYKFLQKDLRIGQSYFNALAIVKPDLANEIQGTEDDCFYDDNKVIKFIRRLNE